MREGRAEVDARVPSASEFSGEYQFVGPDRYASQPSSRREQNGW